jgi:COMPASS component SWD3
MDRKVKRALTMRKMEDVMHKQQSLQEEKKYSPGQVEISSMPGASIKLVNFFGNVHTEVFNIKVNVNNTIVAAGCANGEVKVYDILDGKLLKIGNTSRLSGYPATGLCWKPLKTDDFVACNCDGTIKWYNSSQENAYGHYERNEISYLCCDYQAREEWCVFGTDHNTLEIFDNATMKPSQTYATGGPEELVMDHHVNRIFSVKCLKNDPAVFFSGGWDSVVHVWDVRVPQGSVRKICGPSVSSDSLDIKGNSLLAGNYQNTNIVQIYDFGSGQLIENVDINEPAISTSYCLAALYAHRS